MVQAVYLVKRPHALLSVQLDNQPVESQNINAKKGTGKVRLAPVNHLVVPMAVMDQPMVVENSEIVPDHQFHLI